MKRYRVDRIQYAYAVIDEQTERFMAQFFHKNKNPLRGTRGYDTMELAFEAAQRECSRLNSLSESATKSTENNIIDITLPAGWPVKIKQEESRATPETDPYDIASPEVEGYNAAIDKCIAAYTAEKTEPCVWTHDTYVAEWERSHYHPSCKDTREYEIPGKFCPHCAHQIKVVK